MLPILDFAAKKKGKKKTCDKGYPCGSSCISKKWKCKKPLEGQAGTFADWLKIQGEKKGADIAKKSNVKKQKKSNISKAEKNIATFDKEAIANAIENIDLDALSPFLESLIDESGVDVYATGKKVRDAEGDQILQTLYSKYGHNAPPQVVSKEELDKSVNNGDLEMFRGLSAQGGGLSEVDKHFVQFKEGDHYAGAGVHGNGTYTGYGNKAEKTANGYAYGGGGKNTGIVMRMSLSQDAKIASEEQMEEIKGIQSKFNAKLDAQYDSIQSSDLSDKDLSLIHI